MSDPRDGLGVHPRSKPGFGLCVLQGVNALEGFVHSLNHCRLMGFYTGMSRSCFLPLFIWTSADNSSGIFQTAESLLRFLQTSPSRQRVARTETTSRVDSFWSPLICATLGSGMLGCRVKKGCLKDENKSY